MPTHIEGMEMAGMQSNGSYKCALTYTYPHRFWLVTGSRRKKVDIKSNDSVHLMPVVWETETGIVPPDINPQVQITQDGESVAQLAPWPMLSQPMGFHFGDNVQLGGNGTYQVEVSIGSPSTRRTGSLENNQGQATFSFEFDFQQSALEEIMYRDIPSDTEGTKGAVDPMGMEMMPSTQVPTETDLPGTVRGSATSGDAKFVVTTLTDATPFGGSEDERYLAISPRTPYNRYMLPLMSLSGTLNRGDDAVYDDILQSTIDPELGYHYGAVVDSVESGDELTITVDSPPQTARHEGYETAFFEMDEMTVSL
nr:iron transporter [Haloplanus sp. XH21]